MEHFRNPKNVGEIKNPDGVGEVGNPVCGDIMKITIKVKKRSTDDRLQATVDSSPKTEDYISDIKFQTFGCGAAIATSSITTELAKGKTLEEAEKISNKEVAESLGGLPPVKMHCSNLAATALKKAIEDYRTKNSK
ncbi:iron-sulfur cluster assembly scaffold protein [bacterium (Candidatus Howlettbacteria) CG_4_10_14_0_8_um_filter_40_9]|nr:MAG: iron-sulfur cluster assembly scaffold protein [bacterium (Candidatus Howlettbacteria) CG_4_10_14_0_8_um_filter_40_9]